MLPAPTPFRKRRSNMQGSAMGANVPQPPSGPRGSAAGPNVPRPPKPPKRRGPARPTGYVARNDRLMGR